MAKLIKLQVQAKTLAEARSKIQAQLPPAAAIIVERILGAMTVTATGESENIAYQEAEAQVPQGAEIIARQLLALPTVRTATASAFDTAVAQASIQGKLGAGEIVRSFRAIQEPKAGFLGFGRKVGNYQADIFRPAKTAVTYVTEPAVLAWVGDPRAKPMIEAMKSWYHKSAGGRTGGGICDDCNGKLSPGATYLRPGGYLCCETCTDTFLCAYVDWAEAARNLNSAVGPGVPADIQQLATKIWK